MNERELLALFFKFLSDKPLVVSDEPSIRDMTERYANPPFTMHYRAAMRMTVTDTNRLNWLLKKANEVLQEKGMPVNVP